MKRDRSRLWALAINSLHARILRGFGDKDAPAPKEISLNTHRQKPRDVMSDKPGRAFASAGGGRRSAIEYASDTVAEGQRDFIREVIEVLEAHHRAGEFDHLVIFAEHDMLGLLRQMLPRSLGDLVEREVPKNLLHLSEHELPKAILQELGHGSGVS